MYDLSSDPLYMRIMSNSEKPLPEWTSSHFTGSEGDVGSMPVHDEGVNSEVKPPESHGPLAPQAEEVVGQVPEINMVVSGGVDNTVTDSSQRVEVAGTSEVASVDVRRRESKVRVLVCAVLYYFLPFLLTYSSVTFTIPF